MQMPPSGIRRSSSTGILMSLDSTSQSAAAPRSTRETIGRVLAVSGSQVTVGLSTTNASTGARATVGKFLGLISGASVIVGMITEITERTQQEQDPTCRTIAIIDLVGEIRANAAGAPFFQRGITEYPMIGEPAMLMGDRELRLIYNGT